MKKYYLSAVGCLIIILFSFYTYFWMPFEPSGFLLIDKISDDSAEIILVQKKNKIAFEPYEVSLLAKFSTKANWSQYYVDHGSLYWHNGNLEKISDHVYAIMNGNEIISKIDCVRETYEHSNNWGILYDVIAEKHNVNIQE